MLKPGDLICYNAGGMKYKTLGLVIECRAETIYGKGEILIMWGVVGELMPRKCMTQGKRPLRDWHAKIHSGDLVWHDLGNWFETVK
mgnify:CR=1 FL=1